MKLSAILAGCAIIALGACGSADDANQASNEVNATVEAGNESAVLPEDAAPAANESAATSAPATAVAAVAGAVPTREFMIGSWAEDGDCKMAITFKADGTMDGPFERWEFEDGKLEMVGLPDKFHMKIIDEKTLESRAKGTEAPHKLVRC
jgi:hypothetical protein